MVSLDLYIPAVFSEYHRWQQFRGKRLLKHQVETLEAFQDPAIDVIINTAITGDGKSLAGYLPVVLGDGEVQLIAMYPTNELIKDQYYALQRYPEDFHVSLPRHDMVYGERITQWMHEHNEAKRLEEARKPFLRNEVILTNPDLIHLMMSYQYGWSFLRKELPVTIDFNFNYFLFDEFHIFGPSQILCVGNLLGYFAALYKEKPQERKKFLFLSATPQPQLLSWIERSGLKQKVVTGHYTETDANGDSRCILQACDLSLHAVNKELSSQQWIEAHTEPLLRFFQEQPSSRAAILVYSPATARQLVRMLTEFFAPYGISVGENTGWTTEEERRKALTCQIIVGTSTIDVGIDFHINYLIFEANNAGSFLQRFGRLGRHSEFSRYQAHALVPPFVLERLTVLLKDQKHLTREVLQQGVREAFPSEQVFQNYASTWGRVQAAHVLEELKIQGAPHKDANLGVREALCRQYEQMYGRPEKPVMEKASRKYHQIRQNSPQILEDLLTFRGQDSLNCAVWDCSDHKKLPEGTFLTYNLYFLLTTTTFEVIEKERFLHEVRRRGLTEREFSHAFLFFKVYDFIPERAYIRLSIDMDFTYDERYLHRLLVLEGFQIQQPPNPWNQDVNRVLARQKLTSVVSSIPYQSLKNRYGLGMLFPLYQLQDKHGTQFSVTFGQNALLLETLLRFLPTGNTTGIMA